jgi:hypothetical protein
LQLIFLNNNVIVHNTDKNVTCAAKSKNTGEPRVTSMTDLKDSKPASRSLEAGGCTEFRYATWTMQTQTGGTAGLPVELRDLDRAAMLAEELHN